MEWDDGADFFAWPDDDHENEADICSMIGLTFTSVTGEKGGREMVFTHPDGQRFVFFHEQDCCERVEIEDICGDLSDLVGSPLTVAEERISRNNPHFLAPEDRGHWYRDPESATWTYYEFATIKGSVTVRWYGISNGYYSERVSLQLRHA
jgi:hypothetical protein